MVETQTKNQNIFWFWNDKIDFQKRGDFNFWSPFYNVPTGNIIFRPLLEYAQNILHPKEFRRIFTNLGTPYIRVKNISDLQINLDDIVYISETQESYKIKSGDILITRSGSVGIPAIVEDNLDGISISADFLVVRPIIKKINPYFLVVWLDTSYGQNLIKRTLIGGVQKHINTEGLSNILIPEASFNNQQNVEKIIKEAFQLKKEAEKERREADLILVNSIKGFFITDEQKTFWKWNTDIEIIKTLEPNFWKKTISLKKHPTIKFGDIFNYQKGTEVGSALYQDSGIPFLRVSDLGDLEIQLCNSSKCINETLFDELTDKFQTHKEELLFSKDATIGLVAKVETEEKQIISSGILRLQIKNKNFDSDFLMALLTNKFVNQEFVKNSTGSVIKHLNTQKLSEIELPLIDKQIQKEVASKIKLSISKKTLSKQKLQEAKEFVENLIKKSIKQT